jgi:hypothetical protein
MITRRKPGGGIENVRPAFTWSGADADQTTRTDVAIGQITEDIRNVLEQIRDKQMLQCDVRGMIQSQLSEMRRIRIVLEAAFARKPRKRKKKKA